MSAEVNNVSRVLKLAQKFNCFYLSGLKSLECKPFVVEGCQVGLVRPDVMKQLLRYPEVFQVSPGCVELNPAFRDYEERSNKVDEVLKQLRAENAFIALKGWRDECYEVKTQFNSKSLLKMDRSATCLFGIRNYGVDINGYVRHPTLGLCLWLQKRSATKQTWPGKWDNMVGGGLSVGHGILETAYKEAMEEASVPSNLLTRLTSAGCVSFYFESERGLFPNTEFVYDLELPVEFTPENADGEVETFELLPANECLEKMFTPDFKTTSAPVALDFLIRHGVITPENEKEFLKIIELLHVPLQSIYERYEQSKQRIKENGNSGLKLEQRVN
ncbi:uncharacterized protein LOC109601730 [Aethina tumida]|uniref:uncharacterized protein LOC109601730 n=1 Tax=Aethina tumida TaxID=116153 RepID=UPI0021485815|nr:uncharacterized protein LOC109601730 [Aethina tumida]